MSRKVKSLLEQIGVVDQVGKHHLIVKYVEFGDGTGAEKDAVTEYRLGGRLVLRTGPTTFESIDGRLRFRVL